MKKSPQKKINFSSRKFKYGGSATLFTILVIVLIIVFNVVTTLLVDKFDLKLDMTANQMYRLGDSTQQIADSLKTPVEIKVFNSREDYFDVLREYMTRYGQLSDNVKVTYIDPYTNPTVVDAYKQEGYAIEQNSVLVEGAKRKKLFSINDFFDFNSSTNQIEGIKVEKELTSAIAYVSSEDIPLAVFTNGHNEQPSNSLLDLFYKSNFDVTEAALAVEEIDPKTKILVIAAPSRDFEPGEIKKLDDYMATGGNVMVFIEPGIDKMPNLEAFLADWGIGLTDDLVVEESYYVDNNPIMIHASYAPHKINEYFVTNRYFALMPSSRGLSMLFDKKGNIIVETVLSSTDKSYGKLPGQTENLAREEGDAAGPFNLVMTAYKPVATSMSQEYSHLFVAGSRNMYSDDILAATTYANGDFLVQSINWCYSGQVSVNIPSKRLTPAPMPIMTYQAALLSILYTFLIPIFVIIWGVVVFFRRRHL